MNLEARPLYKVQISYVSHSQFTMWTEALLVMWIKPIASEPYWHVSLLRGKLTSSTNQICCVHKLFFILTFRTIYVHNMFWAWHFHVLNSYFDEQSFVILWVSWCSNTCFWKRFTCNWFITYNNSEAEVFILSLDLLFVE